MLEVPGDLWDFWDAGGYVAITTNGSTVAKQRAVMGRGTALQAATRIPGLPARLGADIARWGNHVRAYPDIRLFTYPVKHHWADPADPNLIARSAEELAQASFGLTVYLPRPGCGAGTGRLSWRDVQPILEQRLDDRFVVVTPPDHYYDA